MITLTLARYILELSLMEYSLVTKRDSVIAAAALYIAMKMKGEGEWVSDYEELAIFHCLLVQGSSPTILIF